MVPFQPILGHGGPDNLTFKAVPLKEGRLCYVDEKELNLRDTALDTIYPADPGETSLKGISGVQNPDIWIVNHKHKWTTVTYCNK